jgi:hypothetical protein
VLEGLEGLATKRAAERVRHTCLAWVEVEGAAAVQGIARIIDLSARGVGLVLSTRIEPGVHVSVELLVLGNLRLASRGEVVHVTAEEGGRCRVGVRFDAPPVLVDRP